MSIIVRFIFICVLKLIYCFIRCYIPFSFFFHPSNATLFLLHVCKYSIRYLYFSLSLSHSTIAPFSLSLISTYTWCIINLKARFLFFFAIELLRVHQTLLYQWTKSTLKSFTNELKYLKMPLSIQSERGGVRWWNANIAYLITKKDNGIVS